MNKAAAAIAVGAGALFFVLETVFPYNPVFSFVVNAVYGSDQAKARTAVSKKLDNPSSAEFDAMRTVEVSKLKYVCGNVNSKDKAGSYVGRRAFVYDVVSDFASVDTDGRAATDSRYRPCQMAIADSKTPVVSVKTAEAPKKEEVSSKASILSNLPVIASSGSSLEQVSNATPRAKVDLAPAGDMQSNLQALSATTATRTKWIAFRSGQSSSKPSTAENDAAIQGALAVDPKSQDYPQAWAAVVDLRRNDLETRTQLEPQSYAEDYQEIHRRISTAAKKCAATKIGPYASLIVNDELRSDAGYGETSVSLVSNEQRNFHLSARVEKTQTGSKLSVRSGNTLGGDNLSNAILRWAGGSSGC